LDDEAAVAIASWGLVAAGGASTAGNAEDDRAGKGGTPRVRSAMQMRSAMRMRSARRRLHRPLAGKAVRLEEISLGFRYVKALVRGVAGKR
jgi:hypothetical protein